jgi:hypothetical protein
MEHPSSSELAELIGRAKTRHWWVERLQSATETMASRRSIRNVLIEIAAQHPLKNGKVPNEEFSARLLMGLCLFSPSKPGETLSRFTSRAVFMLTKEFPTTFR